MDISSYASKFQKPLFKQTKEQVLAAEIFEYLGRQIKFPALMGIIKNQGDMAVREIFEELKKSPAKEPHKLFMWRIGRNKVVWN